jgi:predicted enzyme related to lactoylglutathione lyase
MLKTTTMRSNQHPTYGNGKICYIEIPSIDVQLSATFYKDIFNWNIRERSDGSISFDDAVNEVSGIWVTGKKTTTEQSLLVHIMVDSVEDTVEAIVAHGGQLVQPIGMDAPEITAKFTDPAGNVFGLYQHRHSG